VALPADGEWFLSWLNRASRDIGVERITFALALGITNPANSFGSPRLPPGVGVDLAHAHVESIVRATGLDAVVVTGMLLRPYFGTVLTAAEPEVSTGPVRTGGEWARQEWLSTARSSACPSCLRRSEGVWEAAWRLPWSMICTRHNAYLVSKCPNFGCRLPLRYPGVRRFLHPDLQPLFPQGWVNAASPGPEGGSWCHPVKKHELSSEKPHCLFPHDRVVAVPVEDTQMLEMQSDINRLALATGQQERGRARRWFAELRTHVAAAALDGHPDLLLGSDPVLHQRMTTWCRMRDDLLDAGRKPVTVLMRKVATGPGPVLMAAWVKTAMLQGRITEP
jgi:hypothetical protein